MFQHHCRKCGAVVCGTCSSRKYQLPSQSSKPLRVCDTCYDTLTKTFDIRNVSANLTATGKQPPLPTLVEVPELEPVLFPEQPIMEELEPVPDEEAVELNIPERNPKLYKLVQMSEDDSSFDLSERPSRGFLRQNSSSFWWDANDDHNDVDEHVIVDPFPSTISGTIYKEGT